MSGIFYLMVVQVVLLFGSETWVISPHIRRVMGCFHQQVLRRLTGRQPIRQADVNWYYPALATTMEEAGLEEVETYVTLRQNTIT